MGDETLAELVLPLGMAHEGLVPAEASSDKPVGDINHYGVGPDSWAAMEDQEALQVGRYRSQAVKL